MEIKELQPEQAIDLLEGLKTPEKKDMSLRFGLEEVNTDILSQKDKSNLDIDEDLKIVNNSTDILDSKDKDSKTEDNQDKQDNRPAEELKGLSQYFEQRMRDGILVGINDVDEKGNKTPFIPKTAEDFDQVIQIQVDYKLEQAKQDLENQWLASKSPAWRAISQYADMVDDPSQIIPFLEGVKTIQSVEQLNENEIDGAEEIVRMRLEQRGDPQGVIDSQIEALKTADKLVDAAKQYKPVIIKEEKQFLAQQVKEREIEDQMRAREFEDIRNKAITEIEKPFFGNQVLKREEKALIYKMIAQPSHTDGFPIYTEIDKLYANRDLKKLSKIAMILSDEESFLKYVGVDVAEKTAGSLKRKLQAASENRSSSNNEFDEEKTSVVQRNKFTGNLRFGR